MEGHAVRLPVMRLSPVSLLVGLLMVGFILIFLSAPIGIAQLSVLHKETNREVGYLAAVNWSVVYTLLFPATAYLMVSTLQAVPDVLRRLEQQGMLRDREMAPVSAAPIISKWEELTPGLRFILHVGVIIAVVISMIEWTLGSLVPLATGDASRVEPDWAVGALLQGASGWVRAGNAVFTFFAFSMQALLIASLISFFVLMLRFEQLRSLETTLGIRVIPNLHSDDERCGFEVFEELLRRVLYVSLFTFLMGYCTRLQNLYLESTNRRSLWALVGEDVVAGFGAGLADDSQARITTLLARAFEYDPTGAGLTVGAQGNLSYLTPYIPIVLLTFILLLIADTIRGLAHKAHEEMCIIVDQPGKTIPYGLSRENARKKLDTMAVWPMKYLPFNLLLAISLAAAISLLFVRIGLVVFGIVLATAVLRTTLWIVRYFTGK